MEFLRRLTEVWNPALPSHGPAWVVLVLCICAACGEDLAESSSDSLTVVQEWSTEEVNRSHTSAPLVHLDTVDVSSTANGHRVVFGFREGRLPTYTVRRVEAPLYQCGSGHPLDLGGPHVLEVQFESARAYTEEGTSTLLRREWDKAFSGASRATIACDFEGRIVWALGLPAAGTYRVLSDSTTGRLAVDVRW